MPGSLQQQQQRWLIWGWGEGRGSSLSPVTHTLLWRWRAEMDLSSRRSLKKKKKTFTFAIHPTAPSDRRTASCWKPSGRVIHRIGREREKEISQRVHFLLSPQIPGNKTYRTQSPPCMSSFDAGKRAEIAPVIPTKRAQPRRRAVRGGFCKEVRMH